MKKSLSKQVLFLSLAALVVVSTGCERRGRAPAKPKQEKTAGGGEQQTVAGDPTKDTPAPTDTSATTVEKASEDAKMDCSIAFSSGEPTAQSFAEDYSRFNELSGCLKAKGVDLASTTADDPLESNFITPDGNDLVGIKRTRTDKDAPDAPSLFDTLVQLRDEKDSNEDLAVRILEARLEFLKDVCQKMHARYDGKLDPSTKVEDKTLGAILVDLQLFQEVADKAIKELPELRSIGTDGEDLKKPAGDIH